MTDKVVVDNEEDDIKDEIVTIVEDDEGAIINPTKKEDKESTDDVVDEETKEETDDELNDAKDDEEREKIRERRRQERQQKKEYRQKKEESYRREIESLRRQVAKMNEWKNTVENRRVQSGISQLDKALKDSHDAIEVAKKAIREATDSQNGEALVDAQELYYVARKRAEDLTHLKQRTMQQMQQPPQQNIDPMVVKHAQEWMKGKAWYDPTGKDPDSRIALAIDNMLAEEGWDPHTPEYWEELDSRLKNYLPKRYNMSYSVSNASTNRRSPTGGSSQSRGTANPGEYRLSAERVRAMKEAGMWDDPQKRARMIKRYQEMDKETR